MGSKYEINVRRTDKLSCEIFVAVAFSISDSFIFHFFFLSRSNKNNYAIRKKLEWNLTWTKRFDYSKQCFYAQQKFAFFSRFFESLNFRTNNRFPWWFVAPLLFFFTIFTAWHTFIYDLQFFVCWSNYSNSTIYQK